MYYPKVRTIALSKNLSFSATNIITIKSVNTEEAALPNAV
jgi:hypothetical protein